VNTFSELSEGNKTKKLKVYHNGLIKLLELLNKKTSLPDIGFGTNMLPHEVSKSNRLVFTNKKNFPNPQKMETSGFK